MKGMWRGAAGIVVLALAGCASSTTGFDYDSRFEAGSELFDTIDAVPFTEDDMPSGPGARGSYEGVAGADIRSADGDITRVIADVTMQADFGAGEITGRMDNWQTGDDELLPGVLELSPGIIEEDDMVAVVSGTLTRDGVQSSVEGLVNGTFRGPQAEGLIADFGGDVTTPGRDDGLIVGQVAVERVN